MILFIPCRCWGTTSNWIQINSNNIVSIILISIELTSCFNCLLLRFRTWFSTIWGRLAGFVTTRCGWWAGRTTVTTRWWIRWRRRISTVRRRIRSIVYFISAKTFRKYICSIDLELISVLFEINNIVVNILSADSHYTREVQYYFENSPVPYTFLPVFQ